MTGQKGFSIVETLIGMALIGAIGIALLSGLGTVAKSTASNLNLTKGESLARSQLEYIQNQPYHTAGSGIYPAAYSSISLPSGFSFTTPIGQMVTRINASGSTYNNDTGLQKITVSVKNGLSVFTVSDYKVNR
jgi:type II secretory pathway pseudopilin PulG